MPIWSLDDPQIKNKFKKKRFVHKSSYENHCFVIHEYLDHKLAYKTYLEWKISIRALDCLNITSVSLLGCSFVPKQDLYP